MTFTKRNGGRATTFRRLDDLRALNLLSEKDGLISKRGT